MLMLNTILDLEEDAKWIHWKWIETKMIGVADIKSKVNYGFD